MEPKKIYKSSKNKVVCGVCGGIGEFFKVDPTIIRLLFVLLGCTSTSIFIYIVAAVIMPYDYE